MNAQREVAFMVGDAGPFTFDQMVDTNPDDLALQNWMRTARPGDTFSDGEVCTCISAECGLGVPPLPPMPTCTVSHSDGRPYFRTIVDIEKVGGVAYWRDQGFVVRNPMGEQL